MSDLILTTFDWVPDLPRGYVRGRAMTVVNGGAARMLSEDRDDHPRFNSGDSDYEAEPEMLDDAILFLLQDLQQIHPRRDPARPAGD